MGNKPKRTSSAIAARDWIAEENHPKPYRQFDHLNGEHPLKSVLPDGYKDYEVYQLKQGRVLYFNFDLAKEMGLIAEGHPHKMNRSLEKKILETFNLRIVNEYDLTHKTEIPRRRLKKGRYMATRYLQLQHPDKRGLTSGDGRGIWNGCLQHRGTTWDVSSRGTGVTSFAPGVREAGRALRTGQNDFGYGCGQADLDELVSAAILAEILHRSGIGTERVLTIIDHGEGNGVGVRASPNLLRPAHLFLYLKQNKLEPLARGYQYFLRRQRSNGRLRHSPVHLAGEEASPLETICDRFAHFVAKLEREYIFLWMDWDGDNVLLDAGIIDYGSVRVFGLCHNEYRYDDVDRFSTNLEEQTGKARLTMQVLAQMHSFLESGEKKPLQTFTRHPLLKRFNNQLKVERQVLLLKQFGLSSSQVRYFLKEKMPLVKDLQHWVFKIERVKSRSRFQILADGINKPAAFSFRQWLHQVATHTDPKQLHAKEFFDAKSHFRWLISSYTPTQWSRKRPPQRAMIRSLAKSCQQLWLEIESKWGRSALSECLLRARRCNRLDRISGNALIHITHELLTAKKKDAPLHKIQRWIDQLIEFQSGPGPFSKSYLVDLSKEDPVFRKFLHLLQIYRDDI